MPKIIVRFLRPDQPPQNDDVISISSTEMNDFSVTFRPGDHGQTYTTTMTRKNVYNYVSDVLKSMSYDMDPFDRIQLITDLHPSIMYSAQDMETVEVRRIVEDMVYDSLNNVVTSKPRRT